MMLCRLAKCMKMSIHIFLNVGILSTLAADAFTQHEAFRIGKGFGEMWCNRPVLSHVL